MLFLFEFVRTSIEARIVAVLIFLLLFIRGWLDWTSIGFAVGIHSHITAIFAFLNIISTSLHVALTPYHGFLRRRVHPLPILIHLKTLFLIVLLVVKTVIQIDIPKILHLAALLCDVTQFVLKYSFNCAKYSRFRVEVLVAETYTFFMHILKDRVDFCCWSFACVADDFSCLEIPLFSFFNACVTTSKLTYFLVLMMPYRYYAIIRIKNNAQSVE